MNFNRIEPDPKWKAVLSLAFALVGGVKMVAAMGARILADEQLRKHGTVVCKLGFKDRLPEGTPAGTNGCSGARWVLEASLLPEACRKGQVVRVFKDGWPIKDVMEDGKP